MINYDEKYNAYLELINNKINVFCNKLDCKPEILAESMKYSLLAGGKRIRPVLMLATAETLGVPAEKVLNFALAIELIHTYSLVHDDLPAMDNDDFRRGMPSNHKKFGEGNAILAGDALLNTAYSILFDECANGVEYVSASKHVCDSAGIFGMIAGQSADLLFEKQNSFSEKDLLFIHKNKTAKLIMTSILVPSILTGGKYYSELKQFGENLGYLFQMTDDVLDVEGKFENLGKSVGKDVDENKFTAVKLFGLDGCKLRIDVVGDMCLRLLEGINGDVEFLSEVVNHVKNRIN